MTSLVLTVDPGEITGFALWEEDKQARRGDLRAAGEGRLWTPVAHLVQSVDLLILERIALGGPGSIGHRGLRQAIEVTGVLKFLAERHKIPVIEQSSAVRLGPSARLPKELSWRSPHINDAVLHGIAYFEQKGFSWRFMLPNSSTSAPAAYTGTTSTENSSNPSTNSEKDPSGSGPVSTTVLRGSIQRKSILERL